MNNDTEKADELLRKAITESKEKIAVWEKMSPEVQKTMLPFCEGERRHVALLETIQKDREALKDARASLSITSGPIHRKVSEALASQTETIIRILL